MKKQAKTPEECIDRLQATADALVIEGASPANIMGALVKVALTTANKDRRPAATLDLAARVLMDAAEREFQQVKKDRAEKRRKSRGE